MTSLSRRGLLGAAAGSAAAVAAGATSAHAKPGRGPGHGHGPGHRRGQADLVLHGGSVLLLDRRFTVAEAVAIRGGVVVATGASRELRRWIGRRTEVVNLHGRTALPGINDSHVHGIRTGLALPPYNIDVGLSSIADVAAAVGEAAAAAEPGAWIRGKGWNQDDFAEGRAPTRQDLDAVSPDNPVALLDWSNHQLWVNSRALEVAGITASTQPPAGGVIVKDGSGQPTGLLFETAMGLVNQHIPPFTEEEQTGALQNNISLLLSQGITSYTEPGVGAVQRQIYERLAAAGELRMRVTALLSRDDDTYPVNADQVREILAGRGGRGSGRFRVNGVKLRADGVPIASRTAWMREPYVGGGRGSLVTDGSTDTEKVAELLEMIALVEAAGLQVGTHATGDAAIDVVAEGYARAARGRGRGHGRGRKHRHYVIHGDFAWPETLRLLARSGAGINFNPNIKQLIADSQPGVVGPERAAYQSPYAAALRAGVRVASSSDSPNVVPDWRQGLETILLRQGLSGEVSGPGQRIGLRPALESYTTVGAWQDHAEGWKGSLERGKVGDVCVLDGRLVDRKGRLALPAGEISGLGVAMTVVGGEVAYTAEDAAQRREATAAAGVSWASKPDPGGMCRHC
ncbi:amidohydrolase [Nocardioides caldifontis]|uniref:amidohydrolase n=1 Tax=Nocardioides caldifontis TaxID=2588938 RepID=UPI0011DFB277|nr:amidohydrolase [Nocardioides caldifontis]